jgi:hypothetical protein
VHPAAIAERAAHSRAIRGDPTKQVWQADLVNAARAPRGTLVIQFTARW